MPIQRVGLAVSVVGYDMYLVPTPVGIVLFFSFHFHYEVRLSVVPERLKAGPTTRVLVIDTNDPEFPRLTIPITAIIEDNW